MAEYANAVWALGREDGQEGVAFPRNLVVGDAYSLAVQCSDVLWRGCCWGGQRCSDGGLAEFVCSASPEGFAASRVSPGEVPGQCGPEHPG